MNEEIRKVEKEDIEDLKRVLASSGLFPPEDLDATMYDHFNNPKTLDIWFTCTIDAIPMAIGYCGPEKYTHGTYNLYAIGVMEAVQGRGIGQKMMNFLEAFLKEKGERVLIVETSNIDHYKLARQFYRKLGYREEATIKDFWDEGEDKVIFWKKLR